MHHSKTEKDPDSLIRRYQRAKERRGNWESHWADWCANCRWYRFGAGVFLDTHRASTA